MNELFSALSSKTRRKILEMLKKEELTAGQIAEHFEMTKPSITHHLNILKQTGLISRERKGQYIHYSLNTTVFQDILNWIFKLTEENELREDKNDQTKI